MKIIISLLAILLFTTGCEVKMAPSEIWSKWFRTQTDSVYYKEKADKLVKKISENTFEYEISRVSVVDLVNNKGKAPALGQYFSSRVVEAITSQKAFRVTQKGEVRNVMASLNLEPSYAYTKNELKNLGEALNSQAIITGKVTDLGTNLDVHLTLVDVATGEVISSATEYFTRTKFAVEMLRHY